MIRSDMRRRVLQALNDSVEAPVFFNVDRVNQSLDEGFERLTELAPAVRQELIIPRREGQMLYSIPGLGAPILAPYRIWLPDVRRRLQVVELNDLDARHELWMTVGGTPYWWFPVDWRTFGIWPVPSEGGGVLQIDYYAWGQPLLDDGDEYADLGLEDQELLVFYGECEGYLRQGDVQNAIRLWKQVAGRNADAVAGADLLLNHARDYVRGGRISRSPDGPSAYL
jgi:hypothetical protein